jgi:hypothetical protein
MCSHTADSTDVRACSPASKSLVTLRNRSLVNNDERAAEVWGSRGRRFKSCHPDGKQQVRGRFGQSPRRPLCCRVAIGVATAHVLSNPLLLRAVGRRSARPGWRRAPNPGPPGIMTPIDNSGVSASTKPWPARSGRVAVEAEAGIGTFCSERWEFWEAGRHVA